MDIAIQRRGLWVVNREKESSHGVKAQGVSEYFTWMIDVGGLLIAGSCSQYLSIVVAFLRCGRAMQKVITKGL